MTDILALLQPIQNDFAAVEPNYRSDDCHDRAPNDAGADVIEYRAVPHSELKEFSASLTKAEAEG